MLPPPQTPVDGSAVKVNVFVVGLVPPDVAVTVTRSPAPAVPPTGTLPLPDENPAGGWLTVGAAGAEESGGAPTMTRMRPSPVGAAAACAAASQCVPATVKLMPGTANAPHVWVALATPSQVVLVGGTLVVPSSVLQSSSPVTELRRHSSVAASSTHS